MKPLLLLLCLLAGCSNEKLVCVPCHVPAEKDGERASKGFEYSTPEKKAREGNWFSRSYVAPVGLTHCIPCALAEEPETLLVCYGSTKPRWRYIGMKSNAGLVTMYVRDGEVADKGAK